MLTIITVILSLILSALIYRKGAESQVQLMPIRIPTDEALKQNRESNNRDWE